MKNTETEHLYLAHLADSLARLASSPSGEVSDFPFGKTLALLGSWVCGKVQVETEPIWKAYSSIQKVSFMPLA